MYHLFNLGGKSVSSSRRKTCMYQYSKEEVLTITRVSRKTYLEEKEK